jgi:hypothetical protein
MKTVHKRIEALEDKTTATDCKIKTLDDWYRQFDDPKFKQEYLKKWYGNESE